MLLPTQAQTSVSDSHGHPAGVWLAPLNPDAGLEPGRRLLTPQREEEGTTQGALTPTRHLRSRPMVMVAKPAMTSGL